MGATLSNTYVATNGQINSGVVKLANMATEISNASKLFSWNSSGVPTASMAGMNVKQTITLGADNTVIDFTSLDMNTDGIYVLEYELVGKAGENLKLYVNNDTTDANYDDQWSNIAGTTIGGGWNAGANIAGSMTNGTPTVGKAEFHLVSNSGNLYAYMDIKNIDNASNMRHFWAAMRKNASVANITQITLSCATGFKAASKATLYYMGR